MTTPAPTPVPAPEHELAALVPAPPSAAPTFQERSRVDTGLAARLHRERCAVQRADLCRERGVRFAGPVVVSASVAAVAVLCALAVGDGPAVPLIAPLIAPGPWSRHPRRWPSCSGPRASRSHRDSPAETQRLRERGGPSLGSGVAPPAHPIPVRVLLSPLQHPGVVVALHDDANRQGVGFDSVGAEPGGHSNSGAAGQLVERSEQLELGVGAAHACAHSYVLLTWGGRRHLNAMVRDRSRCQLSFTEDSSLC